MSGETPHWFWATLLLLGAYHGINPGMGWLFAVALGLQEKSGRAVARALIPLGIGHALAIGAVVALMGLARVVLPLAVLRIIAAAILFAFGLYFLLRKKHLSWGGMRVGFADLTLWGFLMASAHGAGLMILPVLFGAMGEASSAGAATQPAMPHEMPGAHAVAPAGLWVGLGVVAVHLAGYLGVAGLAAWIVYTKLGLAMLRTAWLNLDLAWAVALMASSVLVVLL
jgi:hypothetical protein